MRKIFWASLSLVAPSSAAVQTNRSLSSNATVVVTSHNDFAHTSATSTALVHSNQVHLSLLTTAVVPSDTALESNATGTAPAYPMQTRAVLRIQQNSSAAAVGLYNSTSQGGAYQTSNGNFASGDSSSFIQCYTRKLSKPNPYVLY